MDSVFGVEITGAVRFIIAFVVVLALIAVTAWIVRRFGTGGLASAGGRGRQPRLAVIDAASVDARRKLILVRRDNVEHLVMIGGPTDLVIEPNIVRAAPASRETPAVRTNAIPDTMPQRPLPLEEETLWPLQPEPAPRPQRSPQFGAAPAVSQWTPPPPLPAEPAVRAAPSSDTLADLADALATQAPSRPALKSAPEPAVKPAPEPVLKVAPEPVVEPAQPAALHAPRTTAKPPEDVHKMAQELEAALRRPAGGEPKLEFPTERAPVEHVIGPPTASDAGQEAHMAHAATAEVAAVEIKPVTPDERPAQSKKFYETLEQEMASLLGRPTGKT